MPEQIKTRSGSGTDSHARFHSGDDWLEVIEEDFMAAEGLSRRANAGEPRTLLCRCACGNAVYVLSGDVRRRRERP